MVPYTVGVMFDIDLSDAGADAVLHLAEDTELSARRAEAQRLQRALRWADLHGALDPASARRALPGAERLIPVGGDGTPPVAEFAPAELGAVWSVSPGAAERLIGDALDLRHRLPRLWRRILDGDVLPWVAAGRPRPPTPPASTPPT